MILILARASARVRRRASARVRRRASARVRRRGNRPAVFFLLIYGAFLRSPGRPVRVTAPRGQTGRPCGTVCQFANCPNIEHGLYRYTPDPVQLGSHRPQLRPGVTQSHLKPCPPLTFWAFRQSRPESPNSLPTAWQLPYGRSPLPTGSPLTSGVRFSS